MSIRNAGEIIKEARLVAGMSQEKLSDGICSLVALSNIEKGVFGVSPLTFQLLMEKAGSPCEVYPIFENRNDYDCFMHLRHASFHLSVWRLDEANKELKELTAKDYNRNLLYYQEWSYLYALLQYSSGTCDHAHIYDFLYHAIQFFHPDYLNLDFKRSHLSPINIETLILYASELIFQKRHDECLLIYSQLKTYLENCSLSMEEKENLNTKLEILFIRYLIATNDYTAALSECTRYASSPSGAFQNYLLFEVKLMKAIIHYQLNEMDAFDEIIKYLNISSKALNCNYSSYVQNTLSSFGIHQSVPDSSVMPSYDKHYFQPREDLSDGTFNIYGPDVLTIGSLLRTLRSEQKVSQNTLCNGLCSKSMLSKIENDQLNPGTVLAGALLNRLGLSEKEFVFFGDKDETAYYNLRSSLIRINNPQDPEYLDYLNELKELANKTKNPYIKQTYLFFHLEHLPESEEKYNLILEALSVTLKNFNMAQLPNYRLTRNEFTLINYLVNCTSNTTNSFYTISYLQQLLQYRDFASLDIMYASSFYPVCFYCQHTFFFHQKLYSNMVYYLNTMDYSLCNYAPKILSQIYFYHCQALGQLHEVEEAQKYGEYAYALSMMLNSYKAATLIKEALLSDYGITLHV